jgi:anti-anti-sigma factor
VGRPDRRPDTDREGAMAEQEQFASRFEIDAENRICVVSLAGTLDPVAVDDLHPQVQELVRAGFHRFVFDLSQLEHMGSLGLRLLLGLANQLKGGGSVVLCSVSGGVRSIFEMTKLGG